MALADRAELAVRLTLDDRAFSGPLRRVQSTLGRLNTGFGRTGRGVGQLATGFARAGTIIAGAAVTGFALAAKAAIDYEDAFAGVRKTVEASDAELATLSDQFRELARNIPIAATEFARLGEIGGALGIDVTAIDEFVEVAAKLGVTTELSSDQAADALGRIGNILNLASSDFDNFGSALVRLGNEGASTEDEIVEITKRFAAAGKQAGLTTPEILGFAEAAASFTGLKQEAAGSSLSRLVNQLTKVAATSGPARDTLNEIFGGNFKQALKTDTSDALIGLLEGLEGLDQFERTKVLDELGLDSVYLRQLLGGLVENIDGVRTSLANADAGWAGNFLNEEAQKKFETLASQFKILRNNIFDAGITIGTEMLPALKRATARLIAFLKEPGNEEFLKSIGRDIGEAIDKINWDAVARGAKSFVGLMKTALDWTIKILQAIDMLPDSLKAAGAGFLALNKLSGGLIGAGAGNILAGVGSGVLSKLPGKAAGLGKLFAQPVFVTNWPLGFGGGIGGAGKPGIFGRAAGGLGAALGGGALLGAAGILASGAALVAGLVAVQKGIIEPKLQQEAGENISSVEAVIASGDAAQIEAALNGVNAGVASLSGVDRLLYDLNASGVKVHTESLVGALTQALAAEKVNTAQAKTAREDTPADEILKQIARNTRDTPDKTARRQAGGFARLKERLEAAKATVAAGTQKITALQAATKAGVAAAKIAQIAAGHNDAARLAAVIQANRPIVSVVVNGWQTNTIVKTGLTQTQKTNIAKMQNSGVNP